MTYRRLVDEFLKGCEVCDEKSDKLKKKKKKRKGYSDDAADDEDDESLEKTRQRLSDLYKGDKPPAGFIAIPNSTKGGYHKKTGSGYEHWYPGDGDKHGSKPHPEDKGAHEHYKKEGNPFGKDDKAAEKSSLQAAAENPMARYNQEVVGDDVEEAKKIANKLADGIAKTADQCQVSPPTCEGNLGLIRDDMPQLLDEPFSELLKGKDKWKAEAAIAAGADPDMEGTMMDAFLDRLKKQGISITEGGKAHVGDLKATQREIKAGKAYGMADAALKAKKGDWSPDKAPIIVTSDGFILDGHHRFAAMTLLDDDGRREMNTTVVDMPMVALLKESFNMPGVFRADLQDKVVPQDRASALNGTREGTQQLADAAAALKDDDKWKHHAFDARVEDGKEGDAGEGDAGEGDAKEEPAAEGEPQEEPVAETETEGGESKEEPQEASEKEDKPVDLKESKAKLKQMGVTHLVGGLAAELARMGGAGPVVSALASHHKAVQDAKESEKNSKEKEVEKAMKITFGSLVKGGPYIGKRGGKWADAAHTISWKEGTGKAPKDTAGTKAKMALDSGLGKAPKDTAGKIPPGSVVEVSGQVMLRGIKPGKYRVEPGSPHGGLNTYQFFKPRGKRPVARHFADDVDRALRPVGHGDLNKIEIATGTGKAPKDTAGTKAAKDKAAHDKLAAQVTNKDGYVKDLYDPRYS